MNYETNQIYELTPEEAQELCHQGHVFLWIDKERHSKGEPRKRKYKFLGKWNKGDSK